MRPSKPKPKRPAKPAVDVDVGAPASAPPAGDYYTLREIRYQGLLASIEAAKLGLAHDVYQTATRYAAWLGGADPEPPSALPFAHRLRDLVHECIATGEVDHDKVVHDMQVVLGIPTDPPPGGAALSGPRDWPPNPNAAGHAAEALQEGRI